MANKFTKSVLERQAKDFKRETSAARAAAAAPPEIQAATPAAQPEIQATTPAPQPEIQATTPAPQPELQSATPAPQPELQSATPAPAPQSEALAKTATAGDAAPNSDTADTSFTDIQGVSEAARSAAKSTPAKIRTAEPHPAEATMNARASEPLPSAGKRRSAPLDLDSYLVRDGGRSAKNKTFYLDDAVIDGLHSAAAARGIPDSKLVNDILRKILGI